MLLDGSEVVECKESQATNGIYGRVAKDNLCFLFRSQCDVSDDMALSKIVQIPSKLKK